MDNYYSKYLKYKIKYLSLKKQLGGNDENICVLSYNILNPFEKVSNISFKTLLKDLLNTDEESNKIFNQIISEKDNTKDKYTNGICEIIAIADKERYNERLNNILKFCKIYLEAGTIVCLQEINNNTLKKIKEEFSDSYIIISNTEEDRLYSIDRRIKDRPTLKEIISTNITGNIRGFNNISRDELRVTIIPKNFELIKSNDIILKKISNEKIFRKNGVHTLIKDKTDNKYYNIINLHLHYSYETEEDFIEIASILEKSIEEINKEIHQDKKNIILAGDFNKNFATIKPIIEVLELENNGQNEDIKTFIQPNDIVPAPDHILSSMPGNFIVIDKIDGKEILYSNDIIKQILDIIMVYKDKILNKIDTNSIHLLDKEIIDEITHKLRSVNYLSDHYPIYYY